MRKFTKYPSGYVKASSDTVSPEWFIQYLDELPDSAISPDDFDGDIINGEFADDWVSLYIHLPNYLQQAAFDFMGYDPSDEHGELCIKIYYSLANDSIEVGIWEIGAGGVYETFEVPWYITDRFKSLFAEVIENPQNYPFANM